MSDQEVDLNAMIQSDRKKRWHQKQKKRQQYRKQRAQRYQSRRDYDNRDRSRDNRRDDRRRDRQDRDDRGSRRRHERPERPARELVIQSYAISATGFVSDVSLDDILKLAKGKKIINIKAFFERQDGQPLEPGKDNAMTVIINFVQKQEADQFIKEYADKKLDGKNPLEFQFRRGIISRRSQPKQKEESEEESNAKGGIQKQEQSENEQKN